MRETGHGCLNNSDRTALFSIPFNRRVRRIKIDFDHFPENEIERLLLLHAELFFLKALPPNNDRFNFTIKKRDKSF